MLSTLRKSKKSSGNSSRSTPYGLSETTNPINMRIAWIMEKKIRKWEIKKVKFLHEEAEKINLLNFKKKKKEVIVEMLKKAYPVWLLKNKKEIKKFEDDFFRLDNIQNLLSDDEFDEVGEAQLEFPNLQLEEIVESGSHWCLSDHDESCEKQNLGGLNLLGRQNLGQVETDEFSDSDQNLGGGQVEDLLEGFEIDAFFLPLPPQALKLFGGEITLSCSRKYEGKGTDRKGIESGTSSPADGIFLSNQSRSMNIFLPVTKYPHWTQVIFIHNAMDSKVSFIPGKQGSDPEWETFVKFPVIISLAAFSNYLVEAEIEFVYCSHYGMKEKLDVDAIQKYERLLEFALSLNLDREYFPIKLDITQEVGHDDLALIPSINEKRGKFIRFVGAKVHGKVVGNESTIPNSYQFDHGFQRVANLGGGVQNKVQVFPGYFGGLEIDLGLPLWYYSSLGLRRRTYRPTQHRG